MHWAHSVDIDRIDTNDTVMILKDGSSLERDDFTADALDDLLRSALVLGMSAFDRYMHERVIRKIVGAYGKSPLTREQREFSIPVSTAMQIGQAARQAQREGRQIRTANIVRVTVQELLDDRPIQSWRQIDTAFGLIGINGWRGQLQTIYAIPDLKPIQSELGRIVNRRNFIVHEGDLIRHQRGGNVKIRDIQPSFVESGLDFLDGFVGGLEQIS